MTIVRTLAASMPLTIAATIAVSIVAIAGAVRLFGLTAGGGVALYFVIWWIGLFAVLPFGIRSQTEVGEVVAGSEPGAPAAPALREKVIWNTLLASAVLLVAAWVMPLAGL
ncbi:MAG TPA: DUF1467 family protein [Microvirga sp.]|jgi:predicted secreted protein